MCQDVTLAQTYEYVGTLDSLSECVNVTAVGSEELLLLGQVLTVASDDTLGVEHHDVLDLGTQSHVELGTTDGSSTGTVDYNLHLGDVLACYFEGVL